MKKAQGISLNVIIVAAIALLVLVILTLIFTGKMAEWISGVGDCRNKGGRCAAVGENCGEAGTSVEEYPTVYVDYECPRDGEICCLSMRSLPGG